MRIRFVVNGDINQISGGFVYDRALVDALAALGHRLDVVSIPRRGYARALATNLSPSRLVPRAGDRTGSTALPPYDVVVEDELIHPAVLSARPWRGSAPRVSLIHNLRSGQPGEPLPWLKSAVERRYLRQLNGAIAVCSDSLAAARALAGRDFPSLIALPGNDHLPSDLDDPQLLRRHADPGPLRVLHVAASVVPSKGLGRLVRALAPAAAPPDGSAFHLDIVGDRGRDPAYLAAVKAQLSATAPAVPVRWHGLLPRDALCALYRDSHVLALPSDREAYSLACLEALGFGLPVLATNRGGLGEMFAAHPGAAVLLPPEDTAAWADQLTSLARDRVRRSAMAEAALRCHRAHLPWRQVAVRVAAFLTEIVAQSR